MRPAFFRWIFYERINLMIFGGYMTAFFVVGVFVRLKKYFIHTLLLGALAYLFVFQGGNVQHEYYQTVIFPPLAMFAGIGIALFLKHRKNFLHPIIVYPAIVACRPIYHVFVLLQSQGFLHLSGRPEPNGKDTRYIYQTQ